jgi:hypothetical protein
MRFLLVLIFFAYNPLAWGQNGQQLFGARAAGLGQATATLQDAWGIFNNPGGIATTTDLTGVFGYQLFERLDGLSTMGAGVVAPWKQANLGLAAFRFGDDLYNESNLSLTAANTFGIASLGARVNYLQYNVEGFGRRAMAVVDFGGIATLTPLIQVGMFVTNLNQAKVSEFEDERIPTVMRAGIAYLPSKQVTLLMEVEKDVLFRPVTKLGLEYLLVEKVRMRTGVQVNPFRGYFGLGYEGHRIGADYALQHNDIFGFLHQIGIVFKLKNE